LQIETKYLFQEVVLDALKEPIYVIDIDLKIKVWNKAISELTGLHPATVMGKSALEIFSFKNICLTDDLQSDKSSSGFVKIEDSEFRTTLEPIFNGEEHVGFKGGLYSVNQGILTALPREYLTEAINLSPISTIVFNIDGSIMYSNNAYIKMWNLTEENLQFVNHKYNLFLDRQLEKQGLMPLLERAFAGESISSPVFKYSFNTSAVGRHNESQFNWFLAHIFPLHNTEGEVAYFVLNFTDVTEQHELEIAVKESQKNLTLALDGGELGTWDWNATTKEVVYNKRWAEMIGYELSEVYEITWENLLHPEDKERAIKELHDLIEGRSDIYDCEFRLKTKDGKWKWILGRGKVVESDDNENSLRVAGTHSDINDRKLVEEKIKDSELKYRRLVDNAPIGIGILAEEKLVYINKELARMGGVDVDNKEEFIGVSAGSFLPDEESYRIFRERQQLVIEKGEDVPLYLTKLKAINGNILDVEVVSIPIMFEGKSAMQVLLNDITDRKLALKELAKSREMLHQLFENSPMGIVLLDSEYKVSNVNKGFERIFGYKLVELRGKLLTDFVVPPELIEEAKRLNESAIKGEINYFESFRYSKSGEKIPVIIYALPVIENGHNIGLYGIYIDIRKRLEAENELNTRNLELDNFVYKVSHDLRAPLASILGLINLTKLVGDQQEKEYYVDLMEGQVQKLDHFIHDILSHSKNLKMSVASDKVDFNEIVNKCFNDLDYLKLASRIVRKISIDKEEFYSDKWRISEIFRNLIGNAIKYQNPDIHENIIEVNIKIDPQGCEIIVADNGIGISEEKLPHVMEMFYRGTEISDGSGIGLYIVQKAVERINGNLRIESKPEEGTTIKISLPSLRNLVGDRLVDHQ